MKYEKGEDMKDEKVIPYDSPEAARRVTLSGWQSRDGIFWPDSMHNAEHHARWGGCTHLPCEKCGALIRKPGFIHCHECRAKQTEADFAALPRREWKGEPLMAFEGDEFWFTEDAAELWFDCNEGEAPMMVFAVPQFIEEIDGDRFSDDLPDDDEGELPGWLEEALDKFNAEITAQREAGNASCWRHPGRKEAVAAIIKREDFVAKEPAHADQ